MHLLRSFDKNQGDSLIFVNDYDELNRVSEVINTAGITEYHYDRSSLKTQVKYPNGSSTQNSYDKASRVVTIENLQGLAAISRFDYQYDANGNRTQQIETNGGNAETISYQYDANDRLTETAYADVTTNFAYDAAYNRVSEQTTDNASTSITVDKTYSYNNRNQIVLATDNLDASNNASYSFDANGNRLTRSEGTTTHSFIYDSRNQLREITSGGSSIGQFLYDYQGLRIRKQTQTETNRYVYDDQSVLIQTDDSGNTLSKYDYGPDRLLSLNNQTEGTQFYLFDALGSVVNLTKPDTSIQTRIQYDAWGNVRNQVGSSENEFGFTGHEMDEESGLIYMKARYYDPVLGMFMNQDLIEGNANIPPSLHKYLYAFGNPMVFVDPDGRQALPSQSPPSQPTNSVPGNSTNINYGPAANHPQFFQDKNSAGYKFFSVFRKHPLLIVLTIPSDTARTPVQESTIIEDPNTAEGRRQFSENNPGVVDARSGLAPPVNEPKIIVESSQGIEPAKRRESDPPGSIRDKNGRLRDSVTQRFVADQNKPDKTMADKLRSAQQPRFNQNRKKILGENELCEHCQEFPASQLDHLESVKSFADKVEKEELTFDEAVEAVSSPENLVGSCGGGGDKGNCNQVKGSKPASLDADDPKSFTPSNPSDRLKKLLKDN